ncbi:MAG: RNA polymerase sigma-70 factor [Saprospiraceae bacterium]|nr:RNA polymerase sigma-70 factor [Saprospiraceae bacterium]
MTGDKINLELILQTNPEKGFEYIYEHHYDILCKASYRLLLDRDAAEDVVQEVLLEFWNKREQIQINTSIVAYLKRSVYNRSINYIKSKSRFTDDENVLLTYEDEEDSVEEEIFGNEMQQKLDKVMENLPEKCKYAFALSRFEHKTYNEIAEIMDISVKTVENQISKALKILRNSLLVKS